MSLISSPLALLILLSIIILIAFFSKSMILKPTLGKALVRTGSGGLKISFSNSLTVIPALHKIEEVDLTVKQIKPKLKAYQSYISKDGKKLEAELIFYIVVNKNRDAIVDVCFNIGAATTFDIKALGELFAPKFIECSKDAFKNMDAVDIIANTMKVKEAIIQIVGRDLDGYVLSDLAIENIKIM